MSETPKSQGVAMRKKVTDKQRLDWLKNNSANVQLTVDMVDKSERWYVEYMDGAYKWGDAKLTPRQAIDAAMKSKRQGGAK